MVHAETRDQWRGWLGAHHHEPDGVWLVSWKKSTGRRAMPYGDSVEEALCVGWIDSKGNKLDDERTLLWFAPRKARSGWSRPNKERVERLTATGLMLPAGLAVIRTAQEDGSWAKLDAVEDLIEPDDLRAALDADPMARASWDAFPRSAKRGILEWIVLARRPGTRAARVSSTVTEAHEGRRANQWRPPAPDPSAPPE
jgi:uncharacterized protein YdeI (YjbR/CyaY-like superfamily)